MEKYIHVSQTFLTKLMSLSKNKLNELLKICIDTKSAELTGHDNLVYDVITMEQFKEVVEFAIDAKDIIDCIYIGADINLDKPFKILDKYFGEK